MDFGYDASIEFRLIAPGSELSWLDGGLGKLRYDTGNSTFQFAGGVAQGYALRLRELKAVAVVRADGDQKNFILPLETYLPLSAGLDKAAALVGKTRRVLSTILAGEHGARMGQLLDDHSLRHQQLDRGRIAYDRRRKLARLENVNGHVVAHGRSLRLE